MLITIELDYYEDMDERLIDYLDWFDETPKSIDDARALIRDKLQKDFWNWFDTYTMKHGSDISIGVDLNQEEFNEAFNIEPDPHDQWASVVRYYREKSKV